MHFSFCALFLLVLQGAFRAATFAEVKSILTVRTEVDSPLTIGSDDETLPYDTSILWGQEKTVKRVHFADDERPSPISVVNVDDLTAQKQEEEKLADITVEWIENYLIPKFRNGELPSIPMIKRIISKGNFYFGLNYTVENITCPEDGGKVIVVGDIHGQFESTLTIFEDFGFPSEKNIYIFNGDIVDRGDKSLECILMVFAYKSALRDRFFVSRGNHESLSVKEGTFLVECMERLKNYPDAYEDFHDAFDSLPYAYIVDEEFFVCHGGLCPNMDLEFMRIALRSHFDYTNTYELYSLLWNDPCDGTEEFVNEYGVARNPRGGSSLKFDVSVTKDFLERSELELLVRSHQAVENGAKYCHDGKCLTIFSAPNYRGGTNRGAVLIINEEDYFIRQMRA